MKQITKKMRSKKKDKMDGLIVKPNWGDLILSEDKNWEIRGSNTMHRGKHYLMYSGTGMIFGEVDIVGSEPLTEKEFYKGRNRHRLPEGCSYEDLLQRYQTPHKWILCNAKRYEKPVPYVHPQGAVIWVKGVKLIQK